MRTNLLMLAVATVVIANTSTVSLAQQPIQTQPPQHVAHAVPAKAQRLGPHQGTLKAVGDVQAETVVTSGGLEVYIYAANSHPLSLQAARGVAMLSVEGNGKRYRYDLFPSEHNSLKIDIDLSKIAGRQISVDYQLVGVAANTISYQDRTVVPVDQAQADAVAIARQKHCPVSGKPLGSMGSPVAIDANGQRVFVCCAGCVNTVKSNPTKYTTARPRVEVVALTKEDAPLIAGQAKCPVMDETLGSMGQPIKLLVGGKPLFLCCKGCIKKVQADPEKYLAMILSPTSADTVAATTDAVRPGVFKVTAADAPYIAAQKHCPVMDEPLDAMGGPYRVNANGKAIYICCPGCAKKIAAEPAKYLAVLKSQGVAVPLIR